jgi:hypothetical protein
VQIREPKGNNYDTGKTLMKKTVKIDCYGRKKINGVSCYKIGTGYGLLVKSGWQVVKAPSSLSSYAYLLPPAGSQPSCRDITVELEVPTVDQVRPLAERLHAIGQPWSGTEFGFPATYTPRYQTEIVARALLAPEGQGATETYTSTHPATFEIGNHKTVWYMGCKWENNGLHWFGYDSCVDDGPHKTPMRTAHSFTSPSGNISVNITIGRDR